MKIKLIPTKNILLNEEKKYLNKFLEKGLVLNKKGFLFYRFTQKPIESLNNVTNNILLTNEEENLSNLDMDILTEKKFKTLNKKVNYALTSKEFRWLTEKNDLLKWYQNRQGHYLNMANLFGVLGFLILILLMTKILISTAIFWLALLLILIAISNLRKSDACLSGITDISYELGRLTGFEAEYILNFSNSSSEDVKKIEDGISSLGNLRKVSKDTFKIKTPMTKEELIEFIVELGELKSTEFSVTHIGELYVM